jgi:hypothetical protein
LVIENFSSAIESGLLIRLIANSPSLRHVAGDGFIIGLPSVTFNASRKSANDKNHDFSKEIEQKGDEQHHILCNAK